MTVEQMCCRLLVAAAGSEDEAWRRWSPTEVGKWVSLTLSQSSFKDDTVSRTVRTFVAQEIVGEALPHLTVSELVQLAIPLGAAKVIISAISRLPTRAVSSPLTSGSGAGGPRRGGLSYLVSKGGGDSDSDSSSSSGSSGSMEAMLGALLGKLMHPLPRRVCSVCGGVVCPCRLLPVADPLAI